MNKKLRSVQGVELKVANRVYVKTGQELNETFAALSRDVFDSDVKSVDFSQNQQAAATINAFVSNNSNILQPIRLRRPILTIRRTQDIL